MPLELDELELGRMGSVLARKAEQTHKAHELSDAVHQRLSIAF